MVYDFEDYKYDFNYYVEPDGRYCCDGNFNCSETDVPSCIPHIKKSLWSDAYGFNCYVAGIDDEFGIILEMIYDTCNSKNVALIKGMAETTARKIAAKLQTVDVFIEKDAFDTREDVFVSAVHVFINETHTKDEVKEMIRQMWDIYLEDF